MTPQELAQMGALIDSSVDKALTRVLPKMQEQIDALQIAERKREEDIRKHSGAYKDLASSSDRISQNDMRQDAAIAKLVVDMAEVKADVSAAKADGAATKEAVGIVKANQETAATERASTAADITAIKGMVTSYFAQRPGLVTGLVGALVGMVLATIAAATAWLQGLGKH